MERAVGLGEKLGPILLQLPPTLRADADLLDACLRCFESGVRLAVVPRHESWWVPAVRSVLEARGQRCARLGRPMTPLWRTADWGYLRLHEGRAQHVYFNNDPGGAAIDNAVTFAGAVARTGREVTRASVA